MELTQEEIRLVQEHRDQKERDIRKKERSLAYLRIARDYEAWLQHHGRGSSFSTFCDEFQYIGEKREIVFKAVEYIRSCALHHAT